MARTDSNRRMRGPEPDASMQPRDALPQDAGDIVSVIRRGLSETQLDATIYDCPGVERFVCGQLNLGARSAYRYRIIKAPDGRLVAAAEFRHIDSTLFLNYIAVDPAELRKGYATKLILSTLRTSSNDGMRSFALDVATNNYAAIGLYSGRLRMANTGSQCYWVGSLPSGQAGGRYSIPDFVQAEAVHQHFGFSEFTLAASGRTFRVGRLGAKYFRVTQIELIRDVGALAALRELDPTRRLLLVAPAEVPLDSGWRLRFSSCRMAAPISEIVNHRD